MKNYFKTRNWLVVIAPVLIFSISTSAVAGIRWKKDVDQPDLNNTSRVSCEMYLFKTVRSTTSFPDVPGFPEVEFRIRLSQNRMLEKINITIPSVNPAFDRAIERSLLKLKQYPAECPEEFIYKHSLKSQGFSTSFGEENKNNKNQDERPIGIGRFVWPTEGKVISSFDPTRNGIDIAGKVGQPVVAASDGKVLYAKNMRGYGNLIILEHSDSVVTAYAHNKTILVREGQTVIQRQQIAEMGDSDADAVKLRFQIRHMGKPIDPLTLLPVPDSLVVSQNENKEQGLVEDRRSPANEKIQREQQRQNQRVNLQVTHTQPAADGSFTINVQTNTDTASLLVNGSEEGGRLDGSYSIKRIARAGQDTKFEIKVKDIYGNTDTKIITVAREVADSTPRFAELDPSKIKSRPTSDAVAIIIGIQNYKRVLKAEYANDDARVFYDYAIRALGIKPENIKLLIDDQADEVEILGAFQNWLPIKVKKSKTDVYVFYSGHGLPSDDGKSLYILPFGADKQFIDRTAINQQEIIRSLQSVQAKSVTMFMDACYSGQIRTGDTLIASARQVSLKTSNNLFPPEFTVFSASSPDQIASSSPALKHGIFSYYVMKGMEGDADENKDGRITVDELQAYLAEMVGKQALSLNRKQSPQLIGTSGKILVNR